MDQVKIGFIGTGLIATTHMIFIRQIMETLPEGKRISLGKVFDLDRDKAGTFAEIHGFSAAVEEVEELLEDPDINTVYICTPTAFHKEYFLRAAAAGKHIFMEKPLAFYPEDIREMEAAREKAGIQVQVGLVLRYEPVFWFLQELMQKEKERLGSLLSFIFRTDQEWPITGSAHDSAWRSDRSLAYRGCLFEHSIHDLDLLLSFFGDYKGVAARIGYRSRLARESGIEDLATVLLSFENGVSGNLTSIFHRIKGRDVRRLELIFEGGAVVLDGYDLVLPERFRSFTVEFSEEEKMEFSLGEIEEQYRWRHPQLPENTWLFPYLLQSLAFFRSLLEGRAPRPGLAEGRKVHDLLEAIYQSAQE